MEIFASQDVPPVSTTPAANFATSFASVVDNGGKFAEIRYSQLNHKIFNYFVWTPLGSRVNL